MIVGFTGTRRGMTSEQAGRVGELLRALRLDGPVEAHHGDCVGADVEFHDLACRLGCAVVIHPPVDPEHRAWCEPEWLATCAYREPMTHLARNRQIVSECDLLLACPAEDTAQPRGGTWYTVRYAAKAGKDHVVIRPGGSCLTLVRYGLPLMERADRPAR